MGKKVVKVYFVGFFKGFDPYDNFILDAIRKISEIEVKVTSKPDYLFYSVFNDDYLLYDCVRIFFTGENIAPNFQLCDYAIGFERLFFGDRYYRFPFYFGMSEYAADLQRAENKHLNPVDWKTKTGFCSFVYSNADTDSMRKQLFEKLSSYKPVASAGRLYNTMGGYRTDNKLEFDARHKFSIACENSSHLGYATEKIMQAFAAGTIPVYYGDPSIGEEYNTRAFVNCHEYASVDEVLERIIQIDENAYIYEKMIREPAFITEDYIVKMQDGFCDFLKQILVQECEKAYRRNRVFWGARMDEKYRRIYKIEKIFKGMRRMLIGGKRR